MAVVLQVAVRLVLLLAVGGLLGGCSSPEKQAQAHYDRGAKLMEQGDLVKASLEFRTAIQSKADFIPAIYSLGLIAEQEQRWRDAVKLFQDVAERSQDNLDARIHLGYIFSAAGQLDQAEKYAGDAYALRDSNPEVLALKASIALRRGNGVDVVRFAEGALKADPDNLHALIARAAERLLASDPKGALEYLDQATKKNDRDVSLQLMRLRAFAALKDEKAIEGVLVKLAGYYPKNSSFANALTRLYLSTGRRDDAEKALRRFAEDNPDDNTAELGLAEFLRQAKGLEAAQAELQAKINKGGKVFPYRQALADLAFADGKFADAADQMRKLIADSGDSSDAATAKIHLARMLAKNDPAESGKLLDAVILADPKNVDALTARASLRARAGHAADAIEDLRAALNEKPQSALISQMLGEAYERNGSTALAEEQLAKAYQIEPGNPEVGLFYARFLLRYGKSEPAERALTDLRAKLPDNPQVLTELARLKLEKQDWAGAQEVSDAMRKLGGKQETNAADEILGLSLGGQGKFDDSLKVLEAARSHSPDQPASLVDLTRAYFQAGQADKAEELLKSTLAARPNDVQASLLLASLYEATKRISEAEATYKAVIDSSSDNPIAYGALATFYWKNGRLDVAEKTARDGLAKAKDNQSLQLILAAILTASGQHEAAISLYETMFAADPTSTLIANNLASLLSEYRTDQVSVDKAFAIAGRFKDSGIPQFLDTLGWTYYVKGQYPMALTILKSAADKLPNAAAVQYHLGMTYKELGQKDLAEAKLKEAIAIIPPPAPEQVEKAQAALKQLAASSAADQPKAAQ
jgi:tetratricopeptide (TPR) repeat protein